MRRNKKQQQDKTNKQTNNKYNKTHLYEQSLGNSQNKL